MKILTTIAFMLSASLSIAQQKDAAQSYFVRDSAPFGFFSGIKVNSADSADFIRTVALEKNNENLYDVSEYYMDKSVRKIGNSVTKGFAPQYNGKVISYYKNGNLASEELFVSGNRKGVSTYYYASKQLKKRIHYGFDKAGMSELVLIFNDSLGKPFLDEFGTGSFSITDEAGDWVEGTYTEGLKDKTWKKVNVKVNETYVDDYGAGKYLRGKTIDATGKSIAYDKTEQLPTFKGGMSAFGSFLSGMLNYPDEARDNNVQGKVFLTFVIEKNGALTEAKVIRGIGAGCDEEALRVINKSPKWNPGLQRGKPVRVSYTIPISFRLAPAKAKEDMQH